MDRLVAQDVNSFRTAQELSSSKPSQLKRTIKEQEARIIEQDTLIALQNETIRDLARRLAEREDEISILRNHSDVPEGVKHQMEKERREKANRDIEALIEDFEDGFWILFNEQRQRLENGLRSLEQLPAAPEAKSLHARIKTQWSAIESARERNTISSVNALRQMADLEQSVVTYILSRPGLALTTAESFRAGTLLEAFAADRELKQLKTSDTIRIISAREEKKIRREQALRAMRRAERLFPDKVRFEKKGRAARLINIGEANSKTNWACRCIITVCYMICYCHNLLQPFDDLPGGREMMEFVLWGNFLDRLAF